MLQSLNCNKPLGMISQVYLFIIKTRVSLKALFVRLNEKTYDSYIHTV